jgi:hypothetical protein
MKRNGKGMEWFLSPRSGDVRFVLQLQGRSYTNRGDGEKGRRWFGIQKMVGYSCSVPRHDKHQRTRRDGEKRSCQVVLDERQQHQMEGDCNIP